MTDEVEEPYECSHREIRFAVQGGGFHDEVPGFRYCKYCREVFYTGNDPDAATMLARTADENYMRDVIIYLAQQIDKLNKEMADVKNQMRPCVESVLGGGI